MDIYTRVKTKLQEVSQEELIKQIGYNSKKTGLHTLQQFIDSQNLYSWIHIGHYDFKYTATQFFEKLCEVLGIDEKDVALELQELVKYQQELDRFQGDYIYINTNFKRTTQPIFVLAFGESARRIRLDAKEFVFKTPKEILDEVSKIIISHYKKKDGKIQIWGDVVNYVYHHNDEKYIFDIEGNEIKEDIEIVESRVTLRI